jgi:hypothetical protein
MDMAPTGDMCYTGGFDGAICCWVVPSVNIDPHDVYGNKNFSITQEDSRFFQKM